MKFFLIALLLTLNGVESSYANEDFDSCIQGLVLTAQDESTVAELRAQCTRILALPKDTVLGERQRKERALFDSEFALLQHKENYLMPLAYDHKLQQRVTTVSDDLDNLELAFQLSVKSLIWSDVPLFDGQLYAAYTNQSFWQAYNAGESRPFRETNHEPEMFIDFPTPWRVGEWQLGALRVGLNHQSNGRAGDESRSWNRVYSELQFTSQSTELNWRTWWLILGDDDNPDIDEYVGHNELSGLFTKGRSHIYWSARHTLTGASRGSIKIGLSRPFGERNDLRWYLQYFEGYGESLIDYDVNSRRFGIGVKLGG